MNDPRIQTLAKNLVHYSLDLKEGELLYLEIKGKDTLDLAKDIVTETTKVGAVPFLVYSDSSLTNRFLQNCNEKQIIAMTDHHLEMMKRSQAYLGIRGDDNSFDLSGVDPAVMKHYNEHFMGKVHFGHRIPHTRWCVLRYPNASMATLAETNQETFEQFYFDVCNLNYSLLSEHMTSLVDLMNKTDKVKIVGPGTDLTFSIKDIPAIKCDGKINIPDGEVFTAPVKDSVNGVIQYNTPALKESTLFNDIRFEFKDGKIIKATCSGAQEKLDEVLAVDDGAKFIGEFAIGVNPFILKPMKDTLFDEKIWGSIHLTPGNCYDEASNGNKSNLHWDLVLIQREDYGGGEIYFDDVLIRKDGEFVHPDLKAFNRDAFTR